MRKILICLFAFSVVLAGCKKDDAKTCSLSAASIVGSYKLTSVLYKADAATPAIEVFNNPLFFEVCSKDDVYTFNANNVLTYTDAGTVCTPSGSYTGTWSLAGNVVSIDGALATVSSFTCTSMVAAETDAVSGESYTLSFARQ